MNMHETCAGAYNEYVGIFKLMDMEDYAGNGEADTKRIVELEAIIASLPARTVDEQHMKVLAAQMAGLETDGGEAIIESLERDLALYSTNIVVDNGRVPERPYH